MRFSFLLVASWPPGVPSDVGRLLAERGGDLLIAHDPDRVFLGPFSQRCVSLLDRLADEILHYFVPLPAAHEVLGGWYGGLAAAGVRTDPFVRDKVKLATAKRQAVLLGFWGGHTGVSMGEGGGSHESPHRTEAGAVGHSMDPTR
jgi:hypothetical protein